MKRKKMFDLLSQYRKMDKGAGREGLCSKRRAGAAGTGAVLCLLVILCLAGCSSVTEQKGTQEPAGTVPGDVVTDIGQTLPDATPDISPEISPVREESGEIASGPVDEPTLEPADGEPSGSGEEPAQDVGTDPEAEPSPAPHIYTDKIIFSEKDVFCKETIAVEITYDCVSPAAIYYTLDGSVPDKSSEAYSVPITMEASDSEEPNIYNLRAVAYLEDGTRSDVATHSYFVGGLIDSRYSTAVFSITGDPKGFYDPEYGILSYSHRYGRGEKYEREVYVTAVRPDGTLIFEQDCGVRLIGGDSREYPKPSLKLYARKSYSPDRGYFPFDLFGTPRADKPWKNVEKYGRLVLRINGDDSQNAMLRDVLIQRLAQKAGFTDIEAAVPAVVYLNGEYYSLIWVREFYNDEYFRRKYGDSDGEFIVVEEEDTEKHYNSTSSEAERKAVNEFNAMYRKYAYSDLTNEENYAKLCGLIDVQDYLRYFAVELYVANTDWPNNNLYAYRYYPEEGGKAGEGVFDGRWRFLLHDLDYSSGIWNAPEGNSPSLNTWKTVTTPGNKRHSPLFTALMKRPDCRKYFVSFTVKLIADAFSPESVQQTIEELCGQRDGELPYYFPSLEVLRKRYLAGETNYPIYFNPDILKKNIKNLNDFFAKRPEYALKYLNGMQ